MFVIHFQAQDLFVVQMLNSVGDLIDLTKALNPDSDKDYSKMSSLNLLNLIKLQGHCSALVKVCIIHGIGVAGGEMSLHCNIHFTAISSAVLYN